MSDHDTAPTEEIIDHPHNQKVQPPERVPIAFLRELTVLKPWRALSAVATEWLAIAAAIACYHFFPYPWVYVIAVIFIGARQHALTVIGHDASHFRFLPNRFLNDHLGNLLMQWPVFISVAGFRRLHGHHHRFLNTEKDGNRLLWKTHTKEGNTVPEWTYPKTRPQLALKIFRRSFFLTGLRWVLRGLIGMFLIRLSWASVAARIVFYALCAALFTWQGLWLHFLLLWIVPLCTWHIAIQYMRLIAEHSVIKNTDPAFSDTRTTIPTWWESILILPRNIGYHIEHHWYPSVPFYNLPKLHAHLLTQPRFKANADISHSILSSLSRVTKHKENP